MRILVAHNTYHYRGGEDTVVDAEIALLKRHGHEVCLYQRHNTELEHLTSLESGLSALWSRQTVADMLRLHESFQPELIHAHNIFPLISPSLYRIARKLGIPVVQTLHNFRLVCPQAMLMREGRSCTDCVGNVPWRAVLRRCYRGSITQSAATSAMLGLHRLLGTWQHDVTRYIVLNQLCRDIFVDGGLSIEKMRIKPNFVDANAEPEWLERHGGVFIGRLSPEKGIDVLARALQDLPELRIEVYGKGPLQYMVERTAGLDYRGFHSSESLTQRLHRAAYLVMPSIGIESFGLVAVEAFACGTPVIASRHGGLLELVVHGKTGLLVNPGEPEALADAIRYAETHPLEMRRMGMAAYQDYLARFTPEHNYEQLMRIYDDALASLPLPAIDTSNYAEARAGR